MAAVQIKSTKAREQSTQKWGFINTSGDIIIDCIYDYVSSFVNNQAIRKKKTIKRNHRQTKCYCNTYRI
jgi:hypothetical protein